MKIKRQNAARAGVTILHFKYESAFFFQLYKKVLICQQMNKTRGTPLWAVFRWSSSPVFLRQPVGAHFKGRCQRMTAVSVAYEVLQLCSLSPPRAQWTHAAFFNKRIFQRTD